MEGLDEVLQRCKGLGVSFSLNYDESYDSWYFTINALSKEQSFVGKSLPYKFALQDVKEWLHWLEVLPMLN